MDRLSIFDRSRNMRAIKSTGSQPEMVVRRLVHANGFRYRLHRRDLPGRPDIVLRKYRAAILVHGCFWHCHSCVDGHVPKTRTDYWHKKLATNVARDRRNSRKLRALGWRVLVIWECETCDVERISKRVTKFLLNVKKSEGARNL